MLSNAECNQNDTKPTSNRRIVIGLALGASWLTKHAWTREDSQAENFLDPNLYLDLALRAEQAKLDFVFRPDVLFLEPQMAANEPSFNGFDPFTLLSMIASHTNHIGLVATASTSFDSPYTVARQLMSLQWLSNGRAGWNIVTGLSGHDNFGQTAATSSEDRYQKAEEFVNVVKKLWDSYPHDALLIDKASNQFADPAKIQAISHSGEHFTVKGPLNLTCHASGYPAFFQAGASGPGKKFAAKHANVTFAANPDIQSGIKLKQELSANTELAARHASDLKVLPGLSLYLAETREEAEAIYLRTQEGQSDERKFDYIQKLLGTDLRQWPRQHKLTTNDFYNPEFKSYSQTHADLMMSFIERENPSIEAFLQRPEVNGSAHWRVVGTVDDAVDDIVNRHQAGACDGFIAVPNGSMKSVNLFFDQLVPKLQKLGLARTEYQANSLRAQLNESVLHSSTNP